MRIGFYTYGNHQMGMGHVYRCLSIARAMDSAWPGAETVFELKDFVEGWRLVDQLGRKVRAWAVDAVPEGPWDLLFVDQLDAAPAEMRALKARAGCLVSLDDTGAGRYEADFAFNGLYRSHAARPAGSRTRSHEGLDYLLIDEAFSRVERRAPGPVRRVLLSQGGADTYGLVPSLAARLAAWAARSGIVLHALIGPAFRHEAELARAVASSPNVLQIERGRRDMVDLFAGMDLAVSGAGLTACELAAASVPTLLITGEAKELETAAALAERGACVDFGAFSDSSLEALASRLEALGGDVAARGTLSLAAKKAIDGQGMSRMTALIQGALTP